ncbi:FtsP/CotA-like multicopper oxidase with cupredoxin domain [Paenibacillus rhizosphaerae]|uniref:FtsP/CotA-like multicopper oxidase with cupredoxin domain n=1 Tax=Paenibacillus rhizosphaerae TaxID=297318 RepID=A0A839TZA5_9BACL|nr:hypothetical protein [Paenibacillus rhizosphaerae]MBB3132276.1 FtsP/CotA-like multicopper oxidase with cupredoxin domain [Paenibacillus rhizosphaerae]
MDGHDLHEPGVLKNVQFQIAVGQRYDLHVQMPQEGKVIVASDSGLRAALPRSNYSLFDWLMGIASMKSSRSL